RQAGATLIAAADIVKAICNPATHDVISFKEISMSHVLPTPAQLEALKRLGTATIHEAQGQKGAVDPRIRTLDPRFRLAGRALTVDIRPGDNLMLHYALSKASPGDVLVVDAKGFLDAGPWGDVLTL